jgi:hypothetical protein
MPRRQPPAPPPPKTRYFVLNPEAKSFVIGGKDVRVDDRIREEGIEMTEDEALFYVAGGVIGTQDPNKSKAAARAVADAQGEPTVEEKPRRHKPE